MLDKIKALQEEIEKIVVSGKEEVEELRLKYISKKVVSASFLKTLKLFRPNRKKKSDKP